MKNKIHPFRLKKRTYTNGSVIYRVVFDIQPHKTYSSGKATEEEAVAWAYQNIDLVRRRVVAPTFGSFTEYFFLPDVCSWSRRRLQHGRTYAPAYFSSRRGILVNHLQPTLSPWRLDALTPGTLDDLLMELENIRTGAPLAPETRERARQVLKFIFEEAIFQRLVRDNPAAEIPPYCGTENPRTPFTLEEIHRFFPADLDAGRTIWRSLDWYGYFLLLWLGGLRGGESAAFRLCDWVKEEHGGIVQQSIDYRTREIKGLKTAKVGAVAKPIIFTDQMETILTLLEYEGRDPTKPVFRINGHPIKMESALKHLKSVARELGIDMTGRTQYSFRHTFYTEMLKRLPEEDVIRMAGHRRLRKEYDHRQAVDFLQGAAPLRHIISQL